MVSKRSTTAVLKRLRSLMKDSKYVTEKLNAYIVPSGDAHQSEYIADSDKRREFISGFTGSRGLACVTENAAAMWTDGRYFLQADREMDDNWILMKEGVSDTPTLVDWLSKMMPNGGRVGVDPYLVSYQQYKDWSKDMSRNGLALIANPQNLIDIVWGDARPSAPSNPLFPLPIEFSGKSWQDKIDEIRKQMRENNAVILVISALDEIAWLFNLRGSDVPCCPVFFSYAVVGTDFVSLFVDHGKITSAVMEHLTSTPVNNGHKVDVLSYDSVKEHLEQYRLKYADGKIWLGGKGASYALASSLPEERWLDKPSPAIIMKAVKNPVELNGMRKAHIKDAIAHCEMLLWLEEEIERKNRGDISEAIAAEKFLEFRRQQDDFISLSFDTISAVGPNSAKPHYKPPSLHEKNAEEPTVFLSKDKIYLVDSGGQYRDGTTDVTRTVAFTEPTPYQKECFRRVLQGHIHLAVLKFPDNTCGYRLDSVARMPLWDVGLEYRHGTGHGVGHFLNVHEGPAGFSIRMDYLDGIRENMILTIEPGYYEDGAFGIRIENCYIIVKAKTEHQFQNMKFLTFEPLTLVPIQKRLIEPSMLTDAEMEWINTYHATVLETLAPVLEEQGRLDVLKWLRKNTEMMG